jgi:hypothetical protein
MEAKQAMVIMPLSMMEQIQRQLNRLESLEQRLCDDEASLSIEEAAEYCRCKVSTLHKKTSEGEVSYIKGLSKGNTFLKKDLDKLRRKLRVPSNDEVRGRL